MTPPVFTVGHSNRSIDIFLELLASCGVQCLLDVRRLPGSRAMPQFDAQALQASLADAGIAYWRLDALCGRRSAGEVRDLPHDTFWTNASFRRYAAWARGASFGDALDALDARAREEKLVVMCAEAVWWRCHRRIIADHLLARGRDVRHMMGVGKVVPAQLTRGARVADGRPVYAGSSDA